MMIVNLDSPNKEEALFLSRQDVHDSRLYVASLIEWMNCLFDVSALRIVMEMKTNKRFTELGRRLELTGRLMSLIRRVMEKDIELYQNLLPMNGVLSHLEWGLRGFLTCRRQLPLPVSPSPFYAIERLNI